MYKKFIFLTALFIAGSASAQSTRTWMTQNPDIARKSLMEITLPGAHDATTSTIGTNAAECSKGAGVENAKTQNLSVGQMLDIGVRYFDIRMLVKRNEDIENTIFTYHGSTLTAANKFLGCVGPNLERVLNEVGDFAKTHPNEKIVLELSHPFKLDSSVWHLGEYITDANENDFRIARDIFSNSLGDTLVTDKTSLKDVLTTPIGQLNGNVIVMTDLPQKADKSFTAARGFYKKDETSNPQKRATVFDDYSNTFLIYTLLYGGKNNNDNDEKAQAEKVRLAGENGLYTFMAWTLTQSNQLGVACITSITCPEGGSIEELAKVAKKYLSEGLKATVKNGMLPNIVSLDYIDEIDVQKVVRLNFQ
jgi:hypothetical protein